MTRLIQKAGVKCHTEKREKRDGWVNRLVSFFTHKKASSLRELDCRFAARLREFCQMYKICIRFTLKRTCLRAAPFVTACAAPPSCSDLPDTNLLHSCPLSHLLRKCQLSQRESREGAPEGGAGFAAGED